MIKKFVGNMTKPEPLYKKEVGDEVEYWIEGDWGFDIDLGITTNLVPSSNHTYRYIKVEQNSFGVWKEQASWLETDIKLEQI